MRAGNRMSGSEAWHEMTGREGSAKLEFAQRERSGDWTESDANSAETELGLPSEVFNLLFSYRSSL